MVGQITGAFLGSDSTAFTSSGFSRNIFFFLHFFKKRLSRIYLLPQCYNNLQYINKLWLKMLNLFVFLLICNLVGELLGHLDDPEWCLLENIPCRNLRKTRMHDIFVYGQQLQISIPPYFFCLTSFSFRFSPLIEQTSFSWFASCSLCFILVVKLWTVWSVPVEQTPTWLALDTSL